jgi:inhibitor of the pro-sigma K processing machinery
MHCGKGGCPVPTFDLNIVLAVMFGLFVLYFMGKLLVAPARVLLRVLLTGVSGAVILFLFNLIGGLFGLVIGINAVTALLVGYMGLPGLAMIVLLQRMLG